MRSVLIGFIVLFMTTQILHTMFIGVGELYGFDREILYWIVWFPALCMSVWGYCLTQKYFEKVYQ